MLDLTVPGGFGGLKTIEKLVKINPEIIAIAASGYSNDPVFAEPKKFGFSGTIKKPFISRELSVVIDKVLALSPVKTALPVKYML
jgi:DNA-binding NtrC family response regulator